MFVLSNNKEDGMTGEVIVILWVDLILNYLIYRGLKKKAN